jgi:trehalose synthase
MSVKLQDYADVVGQQIVDELHLIAERIGDLRLQNINATSVGGSVAEVLTRMVPLLRELGIQTSWDIIKGDEAFFNVSRAFHSALHGAPTEITDEMFEIFRSSTEMNIRETPVTGDIVMVHDPHPIGLVDQSGADEHRWIWRCHIDISKPDPRVWGFLSDYAERYDASIFSMPDFAQPLPIPQYAVPPSIDPLSDKNKELSAMEIDRVLQKYGLDPARPILTQISRFDSLNDPIGVISAYRMVKRRYNCQLILAGSGSADDIEGAKLLADVQEQAEDDPDIHVLLLPPFSDLEINALVRGSTIIFQKSVREGFGLTVSEALWKHKPVVGGAVGGIKLQVINGATGYLVHSPEGAATRTMQLLADPELRTQMGANGHEHVRQNFLLTRHVKDYMLAMLSLLHPEEDLVSL